MRLVALVRHVHGVAFLLQPLAKGTDEWFVVFNEKDAHGLTSGQDVADGRNVREGGTDSLAAHHPRPCDRHGVTFESYQWCCEKLMRMDLS